MLSARYLNIIERYRHGSRDGQLYHSLNVSEHTYKKWGEIDFVIVGPKEFSLS